MTPPRDDAPPALDRATVEALEGAARAAAPGPWKSVVNRTGSRNIIGAPDADGDTVKVALINNGSGRNADFIARANPSTVLALIADWKILADQNTLAFNHNRDLGASNDELRMRVHRLERALKDIAEMQIPHAEAMDAVMRHKARTALEGSARRG